MHGYILLRFFHCDFSRLSAFYVNGGVRTLLKKSNLYLVSFTMGRGGCGGDIVLLQIVYSLRLCLHLQRIHQNSLTFRLSHERLYLMTRTRMFLVITSLLENTKAQTIVTEGINLYLLLFFQHIRRTFCKDSWCSLAV